MLLRKSREHFMINQQKKILLISHDFQIAGGEVALLNLAKVLVDSGYSCSVVSVLDGPMRSKFKEAGIDTKIFSEKFERYPEKIEEYAKGFDLVIANTVLTYKFADILMNKVPLIWYIHEAHNLVEFIDEYPEIEKVLRRSTNIYAVSEYAKDFIVKNYNKNVRVLHNYVEDEYNKDVIYQKKDDVIDFSIVGYIQPRKAFHLCIDAFLSLSQDIRSGCRLHIAGNFHQEYFDTFKDKIREEDNIFYHGSVDGEEKCSLFERTDVFVVPSYDESCSLIALEACMLGKPLIVSENVGAKYLVDDSNGWVVETGSVQALSYAIESAINNREKLTQMGANSRKKYEEFVSYESYKKNVQMMIEENLSPDYSPMFVSDKKFARLFRKEKIILNFGFAKLSIRPDVSHIMRKLFSLSNGDNHKVLTLLGWKYRFELLKSQDKKSIEDFFKKNFKEKAVLLAEMNNCHGEVLPGYARYFIDLGYRVDVVMSPFEYSLNPFAAFKSDSLHVFGMKKLAIKYLLKNKRISSYDYVVFNSDITENHIADRNSSYFEYLGKIQKPKKSFISIVHQPDAIDELTKKYSKNIILADLPVEITPKPSVVNPHYFGDIKITPKNEDVTDFIVIGNIQRQRKNYDLLMNAIQDLNAKGFSNFKVTVVCQTGRLYYLQEEIKKYIDFRGCLDFENMYKAIEDADFFLPLLDPENPDHDRYIKDGTSGSFQLIYGFAKPCLINKKFAGVHGFDSENSIVYEQNSDLPQAMADAINMSKEEYEKKQTKLKELASDIYKKSLENLRGLLK